MLFRNAHTFNFAGRTYEMRPDCIAISNAGLRVIEVDFSHVASCENRHQTESIRSLPRVWGMCKGLGFKLLILTLGDLRVQWLSRLLPNFPQLLSACSTFDQIGVPAVGA